MKYKEYPPQTVPMCMCRTGRYENGCPYSTPEEKEEIDNGKKVGSLAALLDNI